MVTYLKLHVHWISIERHYREWKCNEEKFFNMSKKNTKRRCPGGGNKAFWPELEEHLFKWVQIERQFKTWSYKSWGNEFLEYI